MSLPDQIRRQSEAIAKHYADTSTGAAVTPPEPPPATPPETAAPPAHDTPLPGADAGSASSPDQSPAAAPDPLATAEQRYRTLQGMYNADAARYKTAIEQMAARVAGLEQLLAGLQTTSQAAPAPAPAPRNPHVTQKDVEEYGESIDVMRRVSRDELAARDARIQQLEQALHSLQTTVVPRVEQIGKRQVQSAEQDFWTAITAAVPDWRSVNSDPQFHAWLREVDPLTGRQRQLHLDEAQKALDAGRAAAFFTTWRASTNTPPSPTPTPRPTPASDLDRQIAPGRGRAGSPATAPQGRTYSPADISKFFDDVRRGLYRGREEERSRIERDIFAAQKENRIVNR